TPTSTLFPYTTLFRSDPYRDGLSVGRGRLFLDRHGGKETGIDELRTKVEDLLRVSHGPAQGEVAPAIHGKRFNPRSRGRSGYHRSEEHTSELQSRMDV